MSISVQNVLLLVLATAVLHAAWNAMAKSIGDRWVSSALIGTVNGALGLVLVGFFGVPAAGSWPYLVASALLQAAYLVLLTHTYAHGDLSRLYPIARGAAPVVVTVIAVGVLAERLSVLSWLGLAVLVAGIVLLACARGLPRADTGPDKGSPDHARLAPPGHQGQGCPALRPHRRGRSDPQMAVVVMRTSASEGSLRRMVRYVLGPEPDGCLR